MSYITFLSTPSGWRATNITITFVDFIVLFLSTPSGWRATQGSQGRRGRRAEFLSTPSGWRATLYRPQRRRRLFLYFNPRPPGGGRRKASNDLLFMSDISIHALRVEGDTDAPYVADKLYISIHALRVEGDLSSYFCYNREYDFYPRPPGGGRRVFPKHATCEHLFLSTPSGWRATT